MRLHIRYRWHTLPTPGRQGWRHVRYAWQIYGHWNEFLWPLVITNSDAARPLTAGLVRFTQLGEIGAQWPLLSAATLIVVLPLLITFLIFQRHFVESFLHTGIK